MEYLKNHDDFNVNITFLENYVKKDDNNIRSENFDVFVNNVRNCNDLFLLLIKDNNNTLKLPNKKCKNIQLYIDNQNFQNEILSDLDAFVELKNKSEYFNEFILDYNRFLNNYTIYSFQFIEIQDLIKTINTLIYQHKELMTTIAKLL